MRLRPYIHDHDFDSIKNWMTDERTHSMWCAGHMQYPLDKADFGRIMSEMYEKHGDCPFVATGDDGSIIGFICCSVNEQNEAMLAFVMIDPARRGHGYGKEMVCLAVKYCFDILKADAVQLNVFTPNERARKCYESAGFTERHTEENAFTYGSESWGRCNMVKRPDVKIEHMAMYVKDLEGARDFFVKYFGAVPNDGYHNKRTDFRSYFLTFGDGVRLEIMTRPDMADDLKSHYRTGYAHIALRMDKDFVDSLTQRLEDDGFEVLSGPRITGDGYYESSVCGFEGNIIEITA